MEMFNPGCTQNVCAPEKAQLPSSKPRARPVASVDRSVDTLTRPRTRGHTKGHPTGPRKAYSVPRSNTQHDLARPVCRTGCSKTPPCAVLARAVQPLPLTSSFMTARTSKENVWYTNTSKENPSSAVSNHAASRCGGNRRAVD
jgi:hypothetical protein